MFQYRFARVVLPVCLLIVFSEAVMAQHGDATSQISNHQPELSINPVIYGMQAIVAGWIFILGACFGSFLNVVIYRLPAGMSLGSPKSRCPKCETPLAARDNIPVFGWLLLRGKCRYCSVPISARYPIIEATCGGIFLLLLFTELLTGGANLPIRHPDHFHVPSTYWLVWLMKWDLSGIYLYHCTMLILALAVAMIGYDGHRPHRGLVRFSIGVGLLFGAAWLELRPVHALQWPDSFYRICWGCEGTESYKRIGSGTWTGVSLIGLLDGVIGLLAGWILGQLAKWQMSFAQLDGATDDQKPAGVFSLLAVGSICQICGVFLGWQACFMLSFLVLPILGCYGFIRRAASQWRSLGVLLFVILTVFLVTWQKFHAASWFPDIDGSLRIFGLASWPARLITLSCISAITLLVKTLLKPSDDSENIPTSLENQ